jgi:hypothetical protein
MRIACRVCAPVIATALGATLPAVELAPSLTMSGHGRGTAIGESRDANNPRHSIGTDVGRHEGSFDAIGELQAGMQYRRDRWTLRADLFASSHPEWADPKEGILLEQAYVEGAFEAGVVRIGRYRNEWLGWEGHHAPDLFRVQHSAAWDWNVQNHALKPNRPFLSDGIALRTPDKSSFQAELHLVKDVLGDGDTSRASDVAVGGAFRLREAGVGMIELGWAFDPNSTATAPGRDTNAVAIDLNAHYTGLLDSGWFFAAEIQAHRHPELTVGNEVYGNDLIALGMVQVDVTATTALTVMVDYVERGFKASRTEVIEYAVAIIERPDPQVRLSGEVYWQDETAYRADRWGVALSAMVLLP